MQRIFCERKSQRRASRRPETGGISVFPAIGSPAGDNDEVEVDELLASIDAVLDHHAA